MLIVGIFLIESLGSKLSEIRETAGIVEEAGFDGLFVGEAHFFEESMPQEQQKAWGLTSAPLVVCMAVAAHTRRLRVGTSVLVLPLHHAVDIAKQAAAVDVLSDGRMVLGVGTGVELNGFGAYGIPYVNRFSLLEEGVEVLRRAWTEEHFTIMARRYRVKNAALNLQPVQKPAIPVWLATRTEAGAKRAARIGDGILIDATTTLEETIDLVKIYRNTCEKRGTRPYVVLMRSICIGVSVAEAREKYESVVVDRLRSYWDWNYLNARYDPWIKQISTAAEVTWELSTKNRMIVGSPEDCIREIHRWRQEVGCDYMMTEFLLPTAGRSRVLEDIRFFGFKVIPRLLK